MMMAVVLWPFLNDHNPFRLPVMMMVVPTVLLNDILYGRLRRIVGWHLLYLLLLVLRRGLLLVLRLRGVLGRIPGLGRGIRIGGRLLLILGGIPRLGRGIVCWLLLLRGIAILRLRRRGVTRVGRLVARCYLRTHRSILDKSQGHLDDSPLFMVFELHWDLR